MIQNKSFVVITFLSIFAENFSYIFGHVSVNSGLKYGNVCTYNETMQGVCKIINKCEFITENPEFRKKIPEQVKKSLCLTKERMQFVCCPSFFKPKNLESSTKIESKFDQATCIKREPLLELGLNIVGGQQASPGEFPFQAMIGYKKKYRRNDDYSYLCSGSLIAEDFVITAASCLRLPGYVASVVKLGAVTLIDDPEDFSESEVIEIQNSKIHPNFLNHIRTNNNIGLIKLNRPFNRSSWSTETICISTNDEHLPYNFTITGYGIDFGRDETKSNWLLTATSKIQSKIEEIQFNITGYNGIESCFGDIGGPLIYGKSFLNGGTLKYLHGIKTFGYSCELSLPSTYTKISPYIEWIKETMESFEKNYSNNLYIFSD